MDFRSCIAVVSVAAICVMAGCDDSNVPLSDPGTSKADARLLGVWRLRDPDGNATLYHVGRIGGKAPAGVLRMVGVTHDNDGRLQAPVELLIFTTSLNNDTYLNMTEGKEQDVKLIEQKGWKKTESFFILKYRLEGDTLVIRTMDRDAKKRAIEAGKIKGVVKKGKYVEQIRFTDTTDKLASFVAAAGDSLFSKEALKLERVK